jgi:VanZ family protein
MSSLARSWVLVIAWVLVIYTTIPFVRILREWFVARWNPLLIGWAVAVVLVVVAVGALLLLARRAGNLRRGAVPWIVAITVVMVAWTFYLRRSPEEAVHFLEYGALALLLHRALRSSIPDASVFVAGALLGAMVGTIDEVIQWFSPSRFWDWRDLVLNAGAGALVQLALWRVVPPTGLRPGPRSLRIVIRLAAVQLLLLTLCLANTPARVARYAPHLPGADHLMSSHNPMAEYGHRHLAPGIGAFKSRLTIDELLAQDRDRAEDVAAVLDASRHRYGEFLDTWSVADDPFTYEARVHLFSRDRNLGKARELGLDRGFSRVRISIARSENLLLERYFGTVLDHSSYRWKPAVREKVESNHDPDFSFRSADGSHLITFASESRLRALMLVLVTLMIAADLALGRYLEVPP